MKNTLHTLLSKGRFRLSCHRLLVGIALACASLFALFGLLSLVQAFWGLRENTVMLIGTLGCLAAICAPLCHLFWNHRRHGSLKAMALLVEEAHPELMDSFICAYELECTANQRELRPIESQLLEQIHERIEDEPEFVPAVFRRRSRWLLPLVAVSVLMLFLITLLPAYEKFAWGWRALTVGDAGIDIEISGAEAARHSDYTIKATVHRWEKQAKILFDSTKSPNANYVMNHVSDNSFSFTFYDVNDDFKFKVTTPSLASGWHRISVYDPPVYEELSMEVEPLPYMQRNARKYNEYCDLELVAGETVKLSLKTAPDVKASLEWEKKSQPLSNDSDGWRRLDFSPAKSGPCTLLLEDKAGHTSHYSMEITVIPDMPPVLALTEPTKDVTLKPGDSLRIMAQVSDDFGLEECQLLYSVNGGERHSLSLRKAEPSTIEKEWEIVSLWDIPSLKLEIGDLLSCMLIAKDNRQPNHQQAKSDLFFVVIRPDQDSMEMESDQAGEEKKADISDLIAESKRLMRLSWDIMGMDSSSLRDRMEKELVVGLNELELEVRKRVTSLAKEVGGNLGEPLTSLFAQVSEQLLAASRMAERRLFEESIPPQERALAALVAIETELIKNSMKSKKGKGEDQQSEEGQNDEKKEEQSSSEKPQPAKPDLKALKELIEELRKIIAQQESINSGLAREDTILESMAARQKKNQEATDALNGRVEPHKELGQASHSLKRASTEMSSGTEALTAGNRQVGGIHGARSRMQLVAALRILEEALRSASANEVKRLSEMAGQLSESQRQEAQNSEQLSQQEKRDEQAASGARERQNTLNEATEQLKREIREAIGELEEDYPKATEAMTEALKQADTRGLQRAQTRAKNALLYKRFDRAAREQNDAGNFLQELANNLHSAAESMPGMGEQELREMLEQLQNTASKMQNAMRDGNQERAMKQIDEAREEAARITDEAANATKNRRLQEISNNLTLPSNGENPTQAGGISLRDIAEAATIIGNMLDDITAKKQRQLLRRSSAPPEKYRRQVEDYFRKLGNE
ncbi:MAG: hypothetical protein IKP00_00870 [Victivallales bacterium]|nr:hypothetical protein [Victivallales bacterium]